MISCTDFIPAYSELFKHLESIGGKEAVVDFWKYLSDGFLNNLRDLVAEYPDSELAGDAQYVIDHGGRISLPEQD